MEKQCRGRRKLFTDDASLLRRKMALTKCFDLFAEDFRRGGIFVTIGHNLQTIFRSRK